uniref:Uncharacterized protein n=1 Tax=Cyclopterus lumpus TaxID=8103 RepID=A0A8C2WF21_CYCLU
MRILLCAGCACYSSRDNFKALFFSSATVRGVRSKSLYIRSNSGPFFPEKQHRFLTARERQLSNHASLCGPSPPLVLSSLMNGAHELTVRSNRGSLLLLLSLSSL